MTTNAKIAALEEERDLLRETLSQTLTALRDLEEQLTQTRAEAQAHGRNLADRHMLGAMNELLETQLETQQKTQQMREDLLGRIVLDDAALIRAQWAHIAELEERVKEIEASTSWRLTAPLRGARRSLG